ncbi:heparinase II/III domain-containing protein [Pedobacter sp. MW01-1-1]|uniref:heparinase II/III domain-containing protein n=1 Tax=Pedobacter sp. MW01-1-1 TaxID=3383027 RepID=UPI003FED9C2F
MKIRFILLSFIFTHFLSHAQQKAARNWLSSSYQSVYGTKTAFPNLKEWQTQEREKIFSAVTKISDTEKAAIRAAADNANTYQWPSLPASLYLDYRNTGTRVNYEKILGERRKMLSNLVIGALLENNDKYIPQIVNGLWLTLEESTWVAPAHIVVQKQGADLPSPSYPYIDLYASRTGLLVAEIYNLLSPRIAKYSKVVNERMVYEMNRRIFEPYAKFDTFSWMGTKGNAVNNWNAYCNTNCMQSALLMMKPNDTLNRFTQKLLRSADQFVNQYPEDGGCDEGPSYWDMAGGKIIRLFMLMNQASEGKMNFKDKELLHEMGNYVYKMQIADNSVVNFADAVASYTQNPESVYRFGELFNDPKLKDYAAYLFKQKGEQITIDDVTDFTQTIQIYAELKKEGTKAPFPAVSVLPNLQVFTTRAKEGSTKALFLACKGGNNNESHNHNDIGNFLVYADGKPLLIDAGVGTYTAKTFSNKRYELWNVQSNWHNCPTINGFDQKDGKQYAAKNFNYTKHGKEEVLSMDIAAAYPAQASIKEWERRFVFNPQKDCITIEDQFQLSAIKANNVVNLLSSQPVEIKNGTLFIGKSAYALHFNPKVFDVKIEEKQMDDARLQKVWGDKLFSIKLIAKTKELTGQYKIEIKKI